MLRFVCVKATLPLLVQMCTYVLIADVANSERHQQLNEILTFTRIILEISKIVCKKTLSGTQEFCEQVYAVRTGLRQVSRAYCMTENFFFLID